MQPVSPMPSNELARATRLSDFDIDYTDLQDSLKDLSKLAAKVAGTSISLINLIDTFTQWTVSNYGMDVDQMPREDSVCQYTILSKHGFEVKDLRTDDRFKDKDYVSGAPGLTYYFGVPLTTGDGYHIGALCVMDKIGTQISDEQAEMLRLLANEVVNHLQCYQQIEQMKRKLKEGRDERRKLAHDIRGPLGGIISLADILLMQGEKNTMNDVIEFVGLMKKSGTSLLELTHEILSADKTVIETDTGSSIQYPFNLEELKQKLEQLYLPQAIGKQVHFQVAIKTDLATTAIPRKHLLPIAGNLISNAIKFTEQNGSVQVELDLAIAKGSRQLLLTVRDTGIGIPEKTTKEIMSGTTCSTEGTAGEMGFGFGLTIVKRLVEKINGTICVSSIEEEGTEFRVSIPV